MDEIERKIQEQKGKTSISKRLKALRAEYGLTQSEVATKLEISQQTYSKYESKDSVIDSEIIKKICQLYGISADSLLGIDAKPTSMSSNLNSYIETDAGIEFIVDRILSKIGEKK